LTLVLYHFCPKSVLTSSCFRVAPMLTSYRNQVMKLHPMTRHSRQRSAPSLDGPFGLRVVHGSRARIFEVMSPNHRPQVANRCSQVMRFLIGCAAIRNDRNSNAINTESLSNRFQKHVSWRTFCAPPLAGRASQSMLRGSPAMGRGPRRRSRITRHAIPNSRYNHAFLGAAGESNT
jgi:hypothetical protein